MCDGGRLSDPGPGWLRPRKTLQGSSQAASAGAKRPDVGVLMCICWQAVRSPVFSPCREASQQYTQGSVTDSSSAPSIQGRVQRQEENELLVG